MTNKQISKHQKSLINRKVILPILETVYLNNDRFISYDLQTYFSMPYATGIRACVPINTFSDALNQMDHPHFSTNENFEITITEGDVEIKAEGYNPDEYPILPTDKEIQFQQVGEWTPAEMEHLKKALAFVSKDDLRPAMTGIFVGKHIAATDAHRLFRKTLKPAIKPSFIMPAKAAKLLTDLPKSNWKIYYGTEWCTEEVKPEPTGRKSGKTKKRRVKKAHVYFISDNDIIVGFRPIDATFPNYSVVIPKKGDLLRMNVTASTLLQEIEKAVEAANPHTHLVTLNLNGTAQIQAHDVDRGTEYKNKFTARYRFLQPGEHNEFSIAFDGAFLSSILKQIEGKATFKFYGPTKCALINNKYLIMPLMVS